MKQLPHKLKWANVMTFTINIDEVIHFNGLKEKLKKKRRIVYKSAMKVDALVFSTLAVSLTYQSHTSVHGNHPHIHWYRSH